MKLTEQEINVLNKITTNSKMDCWFDLRFDKNGNAYVYDLEMGGKLTMKRAMSDILDGLVEGCDYLDTREERLIFNELKRKTLGMKKKDVLEKILYLKKRYEGYIYDEYEDGDEDFLEDIATINIVFDLAKKYYKEV